MSAGLGPQTGAAVATAAAVARSLGLEVRETSVLHASTATTVHLLPCDVVARVEPAAQSSPDLQVEVASQLERLGAPVVPLDPRVPPRVHRHDGSATTFWTRFDTSGSPPVSPEAHGLALQRLHRALRLVSAAVPHLTARVERATGLLARTDLTPRLAPADRRLLLEVLTTDGGTAAGASRQQVLHGEPHAGNLLAGPSGPVFVDWETCCRGPVELDLAHAPAEAAAAYPGADPDLLRSCRRLAVALATTWRYDVEDRLPGGIALGEAWLADLRGGPPSSP